MNGMFKLEGRVRLLHYRDNVLIRTINTHNAIQLNGKVDILAKFFKGTANWTNFYVGLLHTVDFTNNDIPIATLYAAEATGYSEAGRQQINFIAAPDKVTDVSNVFINNDSSNYATFNITAATTLYGIYIVAASTKLVLPTRCWCSAAFGNDDTSPTPLVVAISDVLRVQYTIRIPKA